MEHPFSTQPNRELVALIYQASQELLTRTKTQQTAGDLISLIKQKGLKEVDVYNAMGISWKAWDRIKNNPQLLTLERIGQLAELLNISPDDLYKIVSDRPHAEESVRNQPISSPVQQKDNQDQNFFDVLASRPTSNQQIIERLEVSNSTWTRLRKDFAELNVKRLARLAKTLEMQPEELLLLILRCYPEGDKETHFESYTQEAQQTFEDLYRLG